MLYPRIKLSEDIYWIGTNDRRTSLFENYWPLPNGVAYNSYLVLDEKSNLARHCIDGHYGLILGKAEGNSQWTKN